MTLRRPIEPIGYALTAVAMWPLPLVNRLHAESCAVLALVAWGLAGWSAVGAFRAGDGFRPVLAGRLAMLGLPLILMTVPVLWAPNCDWPRGFLLFLLFPVVTVVLSVSLAWALTGIGVRRSVVVLLALGVAVALAGPVYDVGLHPQLYTYNHVFGGVLGPLYDEEIVWRGGLFAFRGLSLAWAALAWTVGAVRRSPAGSPSKRRGLVAATLASLVIGVAYVASGRLGFNTSERDLKRALPLRVDLGSVVLHLDGTIEPERLERIKSEAAYRHAELVRTLGVEPDGPVRVWVYPDEDRRGRLVGARVTSVAPVWLPAPQVHVLEEQFEALFAHELVHAFSRRFGMPVLRASPSVGLVEGLAVALEPPDGRPDPDEQVAAARTPSTADRLARSLDPLGFWGGRGAVSYTTTGSFVRFLCDAYGVDAVKAVYPGADFEGVFGRSPSDLAADWMASLDGLAWLPVDASRRARTRFAVPSLFERRCPHYVPPSVRHLRASEKAWERRDTLAALRAAQRALAADTGHPSIIGQGLRMYLRAGDESAARRLLRSVPDSLQTAGIALAAADLDALEGRVTAARERYGEVRRSLPVSSREARAALTLRGLLAGHPDLVRILVLGGRVPDRSRALARLRTTVPAGPPSGAVEMLEALVRADLRDFEAAARLMSAASVPHAGLTRGEAAELGLQRLAWASELNESAGDLPAALAYADSAGAAALAMGDLAARRYWMDQAGRLRYVSGLRQVP